MNDAYCKSDVIIISSRRSCSCSIYFEYFMDTFNFSLSKGVYSYAINPCIFKTALLICFATRRYTNLSSIV